MKADRCKQYSLNSKH